MFENILILLLGLAFYTFFDWYVRRKLDDHFPSKRLTA